MSARRYSGRAAIYLSYRDTKNDYACTVVVRAISGQIVARAVNVGAPAHLTSAVDSPEAYDRAAHAAISFVTDESLRDDGQEPLEADAFEQSASGAGWHVTRVREDQNAAAARSRGFDPELKTIVGERDAFTDKVRS